MQGCSRQLFWISFSAARDWLTYATWSKSVFVEGVTFPWGIVMHLVINKPTLTTLHAVYLMASMSILGNTPRKNWGIHIAAFLSRQPLVKGERLVRYEVNAVMQFEVSRQKYNNAKYVCPVLGPSQMNIQLCRMLCTIRVQKKQKPDETKRKLSEKKTKP